MPRYIDADKLKERLQYFSNWCRDERKQGVDFVLDCPLPDIPTEDVVPKSEVEDLQNRLADYERVVGKLSFTVDGVAILLIGKEVEYIQKDLAECFKKMAIKQAKQEVASMIIEHFISKKESLRQVKYYQKEIDDFFLRPLDFWDYIDNFVGLTGEEILAELKKKYIGETK